MVTVADEMPMAHAVDLDRRDRLTAPLGQRQPLPAGPDPARGGPEAAVEVAPRAGGADDRVEPDCLQPQLALAAPAETSMAAPKERALCMTLSYAAAGDAGATGAAGTPIMSRA